MRDTGVIREEVGRQFFRECIRRDSGCAEPRLAGSQNAYITLGNHRMTISHEGLCHGVMRTTVSWSHRIGTSEARNSTASQHQPYQSPTRITISESHPYHPLTIPLALPKISHEKRRVMRALRLQILSVCTQTHQSRYDVQKRDLLASPNNPHTLPRRFLHRITQ